MDRESEKQLLSKALNIKNRFLKMSKVADAGHVGASLSCAEILTYVMFEWAQDDDEIILSKGHVQLYL